MSNFTLPQAGDRISVSPNFLINPGNSGAKSAYTQMIASTAFTFHQIHFRCSLYNPFSNQAVYMDLAVGASGSEVVVIKDLYMPDGGSNGMISDVFVSCVIPSGSRISVRMAGVAVSGNASIVVAIAGFSGNSIMSRRAGTLERLSTNALSTKLTSTASNVWTDLAASTAFAADGLMIGVCSTDSFGGSTFSLGVGASGAEATIVSGYSPTVHTGGETMARAAISYIPIRVPAGVRLSIKFDQAVTANFSAAGYRY